MRHILRGEQIGEEEKDGGNGLAAYAGLSQDAVENRIQSFLRRLPTDGLGGRRLVLWANALLEAARAAGYKV